jgi:hypothetical protein
LVLALLAFSGSATAGAAVVTTSSCIGSYGPHSSGYQLCVGVCSNQNSLERCQGVCPDGSCEGLNGPCIRTTIPATICY